MISSSTHAIDTPRAVRYGSQGPLHLSRNGNHRIAVGAPLAALSPRAWQASRPAGRFLPEGRQAQPVGACGPPGSSP